MCATDCPWPIPAFGLTSRNGLLGGGWDGSDDRGHAAVDVDYLAVHEVGGVGGEIDEGADEILHLAPAAGRGAPSHPCAEVLVVDERLGQLGLEVAWRERIDLDAARREVRAATGGKVDRASILSVSRFDLCRRSLKSRPVSPERYRPRFRRALTTWFSYLARRMGGDLISLRDEHDSWSHARTLRWRDRRFYSRSSELAGSPASTKETSSDRESREE